MTQFDWAFDQVKTFAVPVSELSSDGKKILSLAEVLCGNRRCISGTLQFVLRDRQQERQQIYLFVRRSAPDNPAGAQLGYAYMTQTYAKALRVMCLRIWADASIFPEHVFGTRFYFPGQRIIGEIPEGAELLWAEHNQVAFGNRDSQVPSWFCDAMNGLDVKRLELYRFSVDCAIAFSLLHEIGHNDLQHFGIRSNEVSIKEQELEADKFAFHSLMQNSLSFPSRDVVEKVVPAIITGLLATFMVFQIKQVLERPHSLVDSNSSGYPSIRERVSQLIANLNSLQRARFGGNIRDYANIMRSLVAVSGFHPVYAYVIGIPWKTEGLQGNSISLV